MGISGAGTFLAFDLFLTWTGYFIFGLLPLAPTMTPEVCPFDISLWDLQLVDLPIKRRKPITILNQRDHIALMHPDNMHLFCSACDAAHTRHKGQGWSYSYAHGSAHGTVFVVTLDDLLLWGRMHEWPFFCSKLRIFLRWLTPSGGILHQSKTVLTPALWLPHSLCRVLFFPPYFTDYVHADVNECQPLPK